MKDWCRFSLILKRKNERYDSRNRKKLWKIARKNIKINLNGKWSFINEKLI